MIEDRTESNTEDKIDDKLPINILKDLLPLIHEETYWGSKRTFQISSAVKWITKEFGETELEEIKEETKEEIKEEAMVYKKYSFLFSKDVSSYEHTYGISTVGMHVREKNMTGYSIWHKKWFKQSMIDALNMSSDNISELIYRVFWLDYVYSIQENRLYKIMDGQLIYSEDYLLLRKDIEEIIVELYRRKRSETKDKVLKEKITRLITYLDSYKNQTTICRKCAKKFVVSNIHEI